MALAFSFAELLQRFLENTEFKIIVFSFEKYNKQYIDLFFDNNELFIINIKSIKSIMKMKKKMKECDLIFDFTEGDSFSDIYGMKRFIKICIPKIIAIKSCHKYILCPQTYGPFSKNTSKIISKYIFNNCYYISSRDDLSSDLLFSYYKKKVDTFTDVAFLLKSKDIINDNLCIKVGINVSALLWNGGYNKKNQFKLRLDYKEYINQIIDYCLNDIEASVYLIPHVYSSDIDNNSIENDLYISLLLQKKYPKCVVCMPYDRPDEIKGYISNMDYFIGSRMHSTIAAFSSGVVTIPVSYSRKFEGLYNSLNYPYIIDGRINETKEALEKTKEYLKNKRDLVIAQTKSKELINKKNQLFIRKIELLIKESKK